MLKQIRIQNNFQLGQCSDSRAGSLPAVAPSTFRPLRIFPSTQIYQNIKTSLFSLYPWALSMKTHHCCHSGFPTHSGKSTAIVIVVRKKISFLFYNPSLSVQYVVGRERARHLLTIWHLKAAQLFYTRCNWQQVLWFSVEDYCWQTANKVTMVRENDKLF